MSLRQSFSGFRKKVKDKLSKIGEGTGQGQSNVLDEEFDHSTLSLQSEPAIAVQDELRGEEVGVHPGKDDPEPENSRSVSQPALEMSDDRASEEVTQTDPQPRPHVQTESGPSRERREVEKSQDETQQDRKLIASAETETESILRRVKDSPNAYPPLKSIAEGLYFVLDNWERTEVNEKAIASLAPRIRVLSDSLSAPPNNLKEKEREGELEQKLKEIGQALDLMATPNDPAQPPKKSENEQKLNGLLEDIRYALMDYQTSLQQEFYDENCQSIGHEDRLLLNSMPHTDDAGCRSGNRQGCLRGTRRDVLLQLEHWLKDEQDHRVFWLNGLAGTGKSTIAQTFAEISFADGKLGASFFCSRDFEDRSKLRVIFPTIAFQLAYRYPLFRERLLQVLRATPGIGRESLCSQMEKIVVEPLKATPIRTLIIIDALDECKDEEPASAILSVLSRYVDKIPRVKFFITGRPEPRIRSGFRLKSLRPITEVLRLHDVERSSVDGDIKLFFETQFSDVAKTRSDCNLAEDWPSPQNIDILCRKAAGFFIYASTVVKFVSSPRCPPDERLNIIVSFPQDTSREGRLGIDLLYAQVLGQAFHNVDSHDHEVYSHFKSVLGAVMFVFYPLPINTLSDLLMNCGSPSKISSSLRTLHSVLLVPASTEDPVQIFHKSFPDFLTDPGRCTDHRFFIDPSVHHKEVLLSCLNVMKERLKRNICHLDDHVDLSKIKDLPTLRTTHIGSTLEYACQFWTNHLAKVSSISHGMEEVHKAIDDFFTTSFLFWIEVLVLTGNLDIGVHALNDIEKWYTLTGAPCKWTSDSRLFILDNFDTIQHSPFRMYSSALVLCPPSSWLYSYCTVGVKAVVGSAGWGICTHRTVSHKCCPITLACQNNTVATGYMDSNNIIILDALTGSQLDTLSGHTGVVQSLAFSSDGTLLVSGSHDKTVKLWDIQTGGVAKTLYGHTGQVYSVSVSADNTMVASGSQDMTIRLWDIKTGDCLVIKGHKRPVNAVTFSPTNPQLFLSSSYDGTVRQWSIDGYQIGSSIPGNFVAFSPDGTQFVLYKKKTVTIQNINSRGTVVELKLADYLEYCHFSPDGRHIATISPSVIHLWDITGTNPCLIQTLRHPSRITFLVFLSSYCLISACSDGSIRFWQIGASLGDPVVSNSEPTSLTPAPIQSVSLQAKDNLAFSIDSGGIVKIWDILTGCCKEIHKTQANAIKHGDIQFVDNKFIIVWSEESNQIIHIWDTDTEKGGLRQVFCGSRIMGLRITEDGSRVLVVHWRSINAWSILTGEHVGSKKLKWEKCCFDPLRMNGSRVLVRSGESLVQGWDFGIPGSIPVQFSKVHSERPHLNFVDVRQWSRGSPVRIEDGVTGREVFQLCGRYANPSATQWDGQYLIAGYDSGEVLILDFNHVVV